MSHKRLLWIVGILIVIAAVSVGYVNVEGASLRSKEQRTATSRQRELSTVTPVSLTIPTVASTPTSRPLLAATPVYSVPMLIVRDATNCRTGPGQAYQIIVTYPVDKTLEIIGRYESENFWLVKSIESPTGSCWLWGEYVEVSGSYELLPAVTPPPTTVPPSRPQAPSLQDYKYGCDGFSNTLSFNVIWADRADNEAGYRIIRDGQLIAELPAGSTAYAETIIMPVSRSAEYYVQAYNETGLAEIKVVKLTCDY